MLSFKATRNLGLGFLISALVAINILYFTFQSGLITRLEHISVEQKKLNSWSEVNELSVGIKSDFYRIAVDKSDSTTSVICLTDDLILVLGKAKSLSSQPEEMLKVDEAIGLAYRVKSAVFSYLQEITKGTRGGILAAEEEKIILKDMDDISEFAHTAALDLAKSIEQKNKNNLAQTKRLNNILVPGLLLGTFLAILTAVLIGFMLTRFVKTFTAAMDKISAGNLSYRIPVTSKDEVGRLYSAFNKMTVDLELSKTNLDRIYQTLNRVTDGIEEGIMLIDREFRVLWANQKILDLEGINKEEIIGNFCYRVVHRRHEPCSKQDADVCPAAETIKTGRTATATHVHTDSNGEKHYLEVTIYPIRDERGDIVQFVHLSRDITRMKKMQEELVEYNKELQRVNEELKATHAQLVQSAKMAAIGQLASGVAHEINNPLTGVLNNLQLIKMEATEKKDAKLDDFKDLLDVIEECALRCRKITRSLLDFGHISKGERKGIDLNDLVDKVITLIGHEMQLQNIKIKQDLQPGIPSIPGDSQQLQQVIFNLIGNAKWAIEKKSKRDSDTITIRTESAPEKHGVLVHVSDTGIGISKENQAKIFEPFFTTKDVGEGTGLGLSVVYGIVKDHKGTVEVQSELNKGTTFSIFLPV